jgi:hypothetical protein
MRARQFDQPLIHDGSRMVHRSTMKKSSANFANPQITSTTLAPEIITVLEKAHWPGHCAEKTLLGLTMVHTLQCDTVVQFYVTSDLSYLTTVPVRIGTRGLLFNQQTRNAIALLQNLFTNCSTLFNKAIFCSSITFEEGYKEGMWSCVVCLSDLMSMNTPAENVRSLKVQHELKMAWGELSKETEVYIISSIEEAVETIWSWEGEKEAFVMGSLHLVGGLFLVLDEGQQ